jgi:plasmid stabilization system protein ParE
MTGRCVLSPRAQADLEDIWNHTEGRWGSEQART